eukprot:CAMPEP_0170160716 /NCGR_PEP_ID=MMETSP0033_2-20121228/74190_1 /TAXON_ID=195969 /ORGANISM="Dolichomastix tenuilepis, Strain CCMP3274" /LENGTH=257 /DNA_ID=CAMNT_0010398279 /DNA_START=265 /DNA_END=1034 /DNA_ORIENTATION=-
MSFHCARSSSAVVGAASERQHRRDRHQRAAFRPVCGVGERVRALSRRAGALALEHALRRSGWDVSLMGASYSSHEALSLRDVFLRGQGLTSGLELRAKRVEVRGGVMELARLLAGRGGALSEVEVSGADAVVTPQLAARLAAEWGTVSPPEEVSVRKVNVKGFRIQVSGGGSLGRVILPGVHRLRLENVRTGANAAGLCRSIVTLVPSGGSARHLSAASSVALEEVGDADADAAAAGQALSALSRAAAWVTREADAA